MAADAPDDGLICPPFSCQLPVASDHLYGDTMIPTVIAATPNDTELVSRSLAGDRKAFGQIVSRYQSLICALAYSATGSRSHSEDLAQDTFLAAWRKLSDLREPGRLRAWLCGIARNTIHGDLRRLGRQPAHDAGPLDDAAELPSADAAPTAQAISNEEMAILWREVGRLPDTYREPLVLFYREHRSVESVAAALELSPDAVMQRLSRGRRQLQERMLEFVETTLERTNPDARFTLQVQAALPLLVSGGSAIAGGTAASGGATAKGGLLGGLLAWIAPFVGLLAAIGMSIDAVAQTKTTPERRFMIRWTVALWLSVAGFIVALALVAHASAGLAPRADWTATAPRVAVWFGYAMIVVTLIVLLFHRQTACRRTSEAAGAPASQPLASMPRRVALTFGFLTALFWAPIFLAWKAGDHTAAASIAAGVFVLGAIPLVLGRKTPDTEGTMQAGWAYVAVCGGVFVLILNLRLDVWLAPICGVDLAAMHRLLPMTVIHALSAILIAWTAALGVLARPAGER